MKWLKFLWGILKDQRGVTVTNAMMNDPANQKPGSSGWGGLSNTSLAGAGIAGLSTLLGSLLGGNDTEVDDPYAGLRGQYQSYLSGKLGTSTPYTTNSAFNVDTPEVESAAQKTVLGYLNNPTSNVSDYSEATKKYSEAAKASREIEYADEMKKTNDMYNRLGLVSSTPGLTAQGDLNRKQATEGNLFDADLMYKNLDRQLSAQGLDVTQLNNMLGQASVLGQSQTGRQEYTQKMSMADLERMANEEQGYAGMANSLLGSNSPTTTKTPNIWSSLANSGQDIGTMMLLSSLLGKG